jgi:hypothetical protein
MESKSGTSLWESELIFLRANISYCHQYNCKEDQSRKSRLMSIVKEILCQYYVERMAADPMCIHYSSFLDRLTVISV